MPEYTPMFKEFLEKWGDDKGFHSMVYGLIFTVVLLVLIILFNYKKLVNDYNADYPILQLITFFFCFLIPCIIYFIFGIEYAMIAVIIGFCIFLLLAWLQSIVNDRIGN